MLGLLLYLTYLQILLQTGVATTVIIAYKPKSSEKHLLDADYEVFINEVGEHRLRSKTVKRTITFKPQFRLMKKHLNIRANWKKISTMKNEFNEFRCVKN